jgi:translation initiation factor IF-2
MSETKAKKQRIYKFASEHNLSVDNLIEFLKEKGYEIKSHMSLLTDEMLTDIQLHFKKDIEKAEQHYKKIAEFQKKRAEKSEEPTEIKVEEPVEDQMEVSEIVITDAAEVDKENTEDVASGLTEPADKDIELKKDETTEDVSEEVKVPADDEDSKADSGKFRSPKDAEVGKRKGLKVVGKIDLGEKKKEKIVKEIKAEETSKEKTSDAETAKKKKKPRTKKKAGDAVVEETPVVKKKKKIKKFEIDEKDVKAAIKKTMLSMDDTVASGRASSRKKKRKEREAEEERLLEIRSKEKNVLKVSEYIAVNELANLMSVPVGDVISKCIGLGLMVSINQRLDLETITLVADEFGFEVELQEEYAAEALEDTPDDEELLKTRPPVVTIMGHVDHGKTSLLDYIRSTNVVAGESGGITQHIGAYKVEVEAGKEITFLDTPGHEAFTAMRARGAQLTDIVILVVAADDAVMPQTVEALNHAQAAGVPIIIAINKIDKPGSNPERIKQQLADRNVLVEDWGGKYQIVELSAKQGLNVDQLLEKILLEAEILDLKANPDRIARGAVVEAELDKGRGITGTILVQKGTLKIGDPFVAGIHYGRVRAMFDERGNKVKEAPPSSPVLVLGFEGAPQAGDNFVVIPSEREAKEIANKRSQLKREQDQKQIHHITLDEIAKQISIGGVKELPLIVKGDVDGSVEALSDSLMKLTNEEVVVRVIHKGVGGISESDVLLAAASNAIIIGFHVRPNINARKLAEKSKVDIRLYNVIYDTINEVKSALEGLLSPVISEEVTATIEVRDTFKVPKFGTVAGCYVQDGKIARNNKIRLVRDGIVIHEGDISSLKRFKDDVREVDSGYECGLSIANFNDIKVGDIIEAFKLVETKKKLS